MEMHLSLAQVASLLNIPLRTMYHYNKVGRGPRTLRVGRHLRVASSDLAEWIEKNKMN